MFFRALCVVGLSAHAVSAGGVDRSGQPIGLIFEKGNYVELGFGSIKPSVSGIDARGGRTGSIAKRHLLPSIGIKYDFSDRLSGALLYENAFGADVAYPSALSGGSVVLGGTRAELTSNSVTGILRFKLNDRFSVHGGLRASQADGLVTLSGGGYGALNGYSARFDKTWGTGYLIGGAYEIPDIALRVAVTYFSEVSHKLDTRENIRPGVVGKTDVRTPQAVNLDFQTGIAKDTLLMASVRWAEWSAFKIAPPGFKGAVGPNGSLTTFGDSISYSLGVGRKFNENWSGSVSVSYEPKRADNGTPLSPTNGARGIALGAVYAKDNMKVSMGLRYLKLGDADARVMGNRTASMSNNDAIAFGVKVGFAF